MAKIKTVVGTISISSRGYGFVSPEGKPPFKMDIFIPRKYLKGAVDGDTVEVRTYKRAGKLDGKILKILKRGRKTVLGVITEKNRQYYLTFLRLPGKKRFFDLKTEEKLKVGDIVELKVKKWGEHARDFKATFLKKIANINDPSSDITVAISEFNLREKFNKKILSETKNLKIDDLSEREDLTHLEAITIDPKTAKDFDDAISLEVEKDLYRLGVHIADVSNFVKRGSSLDNEAFKRSNSTYFPGSVIPMLPKELSDDICSLKEGEVRLTVSVIIDFDKSAKIKNYKIFRSYIKSRKRFTYEEAFQILSGKKSSKFFPILKDMEKLAILLKQQRFDRGSIDFALPEAVLDVDLRGDPKGINIVEYDISHQMIEEFMLKANEIVAKHLSKKRKTLIFRIHEPPSEKPFLDFYAYVTTLGFDLPPSPTKKDLQNLFIEAKKSPMLRQLSISFIKNMKMALYSKENVGHYGLSLEYYCHFTSPIRRYSDLVIHRLLFEKKGVDNLEEISRKCSENERKSFKAESSVIFIKKLRLIEKNFKKNPEKTYEALITKISPNAVFFEIEEFFLESSIHISELGDEYYIYREDVKQIEGELTGKNFSLGKEVKVRIKNLDLLSLELNWIIV